MNAPDRTPRHVREWLRRSTPTPPDAEQSVDEVMTTLFRQSQLRPRMSFRLWAERARSEGGFSMFSALKVGVATALVALVGGVLALSLLPQPQEPLPPAAEATEVAVGDLPRYAAIEGKVYAHSETNRATEARQEGLPEVIGTDWGYRGLVETNDPRLNGFYDTNQNYHQFLAPPASGTVRSGIGRISNKGGSWAAELYGFSRPGESDHSANHYVSFLTGEGGYEGLSAMLWMDPEPGTHWRLEGVIAPGPMPEPPDTLFLDESE